MSTDNIPGATNFTVSKLYDGIDYHFRPETFWETPSDPLAAILRNVKGRNRRKMIRDHCVAGKLDELYDDLLNNIPNDETRKLLPRIHPTFMGMRKEVDIVTIELVQRNA